MIAESFSPMRPMPKKDTIGSCITMTITVSMNRPASSFLFVRYLHTESHQSHIQTNDQSETIGQIGIVPICKGYENPDKAHQAYDLRLN